MPIHFSKIIETAISLVVTSVFIGACAIVWRGATTVQERIDATSNNFKNLVDNLSSKLSAYEIQLASQSNQIAELSYLIKEGLVSDIDARKKLNKRENTPDVRQEGIRQDIQQQLYKGAK